MHTFADVINYFGGIAGLARKLGVTTQAISQWKGKIPEGRGYQVEVLSGGHFKADRLPLKKAERRSH